MDPLSITSAILQGGSALTGVAESISNIIYGNKRNKLAEKIHAENLAFQREHFAYEKALQREIFNREDSAIRRRVEDLKSAGMSPLLAANGEGASAGQAIATEALQSEYIPPENPLAGITDAMSKIAAIQKTTLETQNLNQQNIGVALNNRLLKADVDIKEELGKKLAQINLGIVNEQLIDLQNKNSKFSKEMEALGLNNKLLAKNLELEQQELMKRVWDTRNAKLQGDNMAFDLSVKKQDKAMYDDISKKIGIPIPINNYTPLNFASNALGGIFDGLLGIFGKKFKLLMKTFGYGDK